MFILGELFYALANFVNILCTILFWVLVARIVLSWFPVDPYNSIIQMIIQITDPILMPFRRLPLRMGMIDFSPILAFVALTLVHRVAVGILVTIAQQFGTAPGL